MFHLKISIIPVIFFVHLVTSTDIDDSFIHACEIDDILFEQANWTVVREHNRYRKLYNMSLLELSKNLSKECQEYAEILATYCGSVVAKKPVYNFSLDYRTKKRANPACILADWYRREIPLYAQRRRTWRNDMKHVIPMLWKSTLEIGVGMAKCNKSQTYVLVCFYLPRMKESEIEDNFFNPVIKPYLKNLPSGAVSTNSIAVCLLAMVALVKIC